MRLSVLILPVVLMLMACGAQPGPMFFGAERHDLVVFRKEDHVEVIRLGYLSRAGRDAVPALMERAAAQATGCMVVGPGRGMWSSPSLIGDSGEATFELAC
jgi:hypothetical protein